MLLSTPISLNMRVLRSKVSSEVEPPAPQVKSMNKPSVMHYHKESWGEQQRGCSCLIQSCTHDTHDTRHTLLLVAANASHKGLQAGVCLGGKELKGDKALPSLLLGSDQVHNLFSRHVGLVLCFFFTCLNCAKHWACVRDTETL